MTKIHKLHDQSTRVAEIVALRQIEAWLLSPDFPQRPPAEIASILSEMREARDAQHSAAIARSASPKVVSLFPTALSAVVSN